MAVPVTAANTLTERSEVHASNGIGGTPASEHDVVAIIDLADRGVLEQDLATGLEDCRWIDQSSKQQVAIRIDPLPESLSIAQQLVCGDELTEECRANVKPMTVCYQLDLHRFSIDASSGPRSLKRAPF